MGFPALFRALMSQTDPQKNVILSNGIGYHSESESQGFYCSCPSFAWSLYKLVLNIAFGGSKLLLVFQQSQGHLSRKTVKSMELCCTAQKLKFIDCVSENI